MSDDKLYKRVGRVVAGAAVLAVVLQLLFWLALITGALWLLKRFGVI